MGHELYGVVKAALTPVSDEMLQSTHPSMGQLVGSTNSGLEADRLSMVCRCGGGRQGTWTGAGRLAAWCPDANACLPGACADKTSDYSHSCPSGYEESFSTEYEHNCNREIYGVQIAINNADHVSSSAIKFEETVLWNVR